MAVEVREGESTGSNLIWAVTFLLIVGGIIAALYFSGILSSASKPAKQNTTINVETSAPSR
jgi:hypothetical protein